MTGGRDRGGHAPRVVIVQAGIKRYRESFYEHLRAELERRGIELEVLHSNRGVATTRGDELDLPWAREVYGRRVRFRDSDLTWQWWLPRVRRGDLVVVEQAARMLANYPALLAQRLGRFRVAMWGHGTSFHDSDNGMVASARRRMTLRAHWFFGYTEESKRIVTSWGYPAARVTVVRNAIDTRGLAGLVKRAGDDADALRARLGLRGKNVGLFIGSIHPEKRLDFLAEACDRVRQRVPDFELVIAGGGPQADRAREIAAGRPWAHYVGPVFREELAAVLRLGTLVLVPAWVGLVAVDSLAGAVPLVASGAAAHPPEIAYVEHGVNGWIADDGGDPARYADAVVELLLDEHRRAELVAGCARTRDSYSSEDMAARFAEGLQQALA